MHPKDDLLRAFTDHELSEKQAQQIREHLLHCRECQAQLDEITRRTAQVQAKLNVLVPGPTEQPRTAQLAYKRFANNTRLSMERKETFKDMFTKRPLWVGLTLLVALVLVFSLTPASAWASSFLGMFRVQKVQVVSFDPIAAENARQQVNANSDAIRQVFKDDLKITNHGEVVQVASAAEAAEKASFTPRLPSALPDAKLSVKPGMNAVFTINQPKLQALMDAAGVNAKLPENINGKTVTVDVANAVVASSPDCPDPSASVDKQDVTNCTALVQMPSPIVNTPDGLDVPKLGTAMFQFLGLSEAEAEQLSQRIDWTTTLVLPIPQGSEIQYQDVQVDGVTGTLLQETGKNNYSLIWVKNGIVYGLHGVGSAQDGLKIAGSLK